MAKTLFVNGNPAQGILGTVVTAEFLNAVNKHHHTGKDVDGEGALPYAADTGAADAYAIALDPVLSEYITGMPIFFKAENTNTGASTLDINGLGVKTIKKNGASDLAAGDIEAGQITIIAYDGTNFQLLNPVIVNRCAGGTFSNLRASASGTSANVNVSADEIVVESASNVHAALRNVSLAINIAGSGANGLDTGTLAVSTWYSLWVIYNPTTQTAAGLISLSATAPTYPSGYTFKARAGWIRTDGTANKYPLSFIQYGRRVQYKVASNSNLTAFPSLASGNQGDVSIPTWAAVSVSAVVPTTASEIVVVVCGGASPGVTMCAPNANYGTYNSQAAPPPVELDLVANLPTSISASMVLESTSIYYASNAGGGSALVASGWIDNL